MDAIRLAIGLVLAAAGPAWADDAGDAKAVVTAIYDSYAQGHRPPSLDSYYSDGLKAQFAKYRQTANATAGVGATLARPVTDIQFDPFVDATHYLIAGLAIGEPVMNGRHAVINVGYVNFDHPTELSISLVKQADGWKVDDVAMLGGDTHWLLSWLLTYDPVGTD